MRFATACLALSAAALSSVDALPSLFGGRGATAPAPEGGPAPTRNLQKGKATGNGKQSDGNGGGNGNGGGGGGGGNGNGNSGGQRGKQASEYAFPAPAPVEGSEPPTAEDIPPPPPAGDGTCEAEDGTALGPDCEPIDDLDAVYDQVLIESMWENPPAGADDEDDLNGDGGEEGGGGDKVRGPPQGFDYNPKKVKSSVKDGPGGGKGNGNGPGGDKKKDKVRALSSEDLLQMQNEEDGHLHDQTHRGLTGATSGIGMFLPLTCNPASFDGADCSVGVSSLGWDTTSTLVIPCGGCYTWDLGDATLPEGLDVQGKLLFPPDIVATVSTTHVVVQGELDVSSTKAVSDANRSVKFLLTGTADKSFVPQAPNDAACGGGACSIGKKAFVVAGGKLNVRALDESAPTWTKLLGLARGQAAPLAAGEYDALPTFPTGNDVCSADGTIVREDFSNGIPQYYSGYTGAFADIGPEGEMIVSNRRNDWQGPFIDLTRSIPCLVPGITYLLTIRYKLDHPDPAMVGQPTQCETSSNNNGQACVHIRSETRKPDGNTHAPWKWGTGWKKGAKYGEWRVASAAITFDDVEANPDNMWWYFQLRGAEADTKVSVSEFILAPPDAEHFSADGTAACQELVPGGSGELHGLNVYPFTKNYGDMYLSKKTETSAVDSSTNSYFSLEFRDYNWNSLKSYPNARCLQMGLTYTISYKLRVHSSDPVDSYVKFVYKVPVEGGDPVQKSPEIARCSTQQTLSDGWVECRRDFTVDEELSTAIPGTWYWEIFLSGNGASTTADVDLDDLSIYQKGGPVEGLLLPDTVVDKWGPGAEIHVTSGTYQDKDSENAVVESITDRGDGTATVKLQGMLGAPTVTEEDQPGYGVEVALLTRNVVIEGTDEEVDMGGYVQILHTPDVAQTFEGVELRNMGQLGLRNRFALQLLYSGSVLGTSISRNSIVKSNHRCISVDGTSNATIAGNTAYDNVGNCYYAGYSSYNNTFAGNLGSVIPTNRIFWHTRVDAAIDNLDPDGTIFMLRSIGNNLIGNVAAGSPWDCYRIFPNWRTGTEDGNAWLYGGENNGRRTPLGTFEDNVAHSCRHGYHFTDLEQAFDAGKTNPVVSGLRAYRNREWGAYVWASQGISFLGGESSENRWGVAFKWSEDTKLHDFTIRGLTDATDAHLMAVTGSWKMCNGWGQEGFKFSPAARNAFGNHKLRGVDAKNVVVEGYDHPDRCPGSQPLRMFGEQLQNKHHNLNTAFDGLTVNDVNGKYLDLCPAVNLGVDDAYVHDYTGALDPSGAASFGVVVANDAKMTDMAPNACTAYPETCTAYCPGTCYRTLTYRTDRDFTASFTLVVTDESTGKTTSTSGKTFQYNGDVHQETYDDWNRMMFFSVPLPSTGGPFQAKFVDASSNDVWPRWYEEWWEPAPTSPPCGPIPGPGDVTMYEPPVTPADTIAINGALDDGMACWRHNGGGNAIVPAPPGGLGPTTNALQSTNRHSWWHYHGQYLDMRPFLENPESLHEVSASVKVHSKSSGLPVSCNPNVDMWNGGCPRITLRFTYHSDATQKDGGHFHHYIGDVARVALNHDPDNLTRMFGVMKKPAQIDQFLNHGGAHTLLLYIENGHPDWQFTVDDVAVKPLLRPGTCDDNVVNNADFNNEGGDSRYWWFYHGAHLSMTQGVSGEPDDKALVVSNRMGWSHRTVMQRVDVGTCYAPGDKIMITAKYRLLDAADGSDKTWECNHKSWGGNDGCLFGWHWMKSRTTGGTRHERGGYPVLSPGDGAPGGWATMTHYYTVHDDFGDLDESFINFEAGVNYHPVIDDVQMKRIPKTCSTNLLMNPTMDEDSAFWYSNNRGVATLSLVSPGAGGTGHALRVNRIDANGNGHGWVGIEQMLDTSCLTVGEELTIRGKFRLLDSAGVGVECDPGARGAHEGIVCPQIVMEGHECTVGNANIWLKFWNDIPFFEWDAAAYNDFETSFYVDDALKSCGRVRVQVRDVDPQYDIVVDDLMIIPPAIPTPAPTPAPVESGPITDMPTAAPVTLAPTSVVQSCPAVGSSSVVDAALPIMLARSSDLCLLTKNNVTGGTPIPLGRSYLDEDWELSAGTTAEALDGWACYDVGCQIALPPVDAGYEYRLTSYTYTLPDKDQAARLLESATFGPKYDEVTALSAPIGTSGIDGAAADWIAAQMDSTVTPVTSHRAYWRSRMNMQYDSTHTAGTTDHPCDRHSRWKTYSTSGFDSIWTAVHSLSTAALGADGGEPYSVTIDGHVRTVVNAADFGQFYPWQTDANGNQYTFEYGREYGVCGIDHMNINLRMDDDSCRSFPSPKVNFPPEHESLAGTNVLQLASGDVLEVNNPNYDGTTGNEFILDAAGGLNDPKCDTIPPYNEVGNAPIFGKLTDGTWVMWDYRMRLKSNEPGALLSNTDGDADGGGSLQLATGGVALCSNAPRTFLNEDSCQLSTATSACNSAPMPEIHIDLTEDTIKALHNLTREDGVDEEGNPNEGRYVYAIDGLMVRDLFDNTVPHPCTYGKRSRWQLKDVATEGACAPTTLSEITNETLFNLLHMSSDPHPTLRDIEVSVAQGDADTTCHPDDLTAGPEVEIDVDGSCWVHVHPDYMSVYDLSYWARDDAHPGNMDAMMMYDPPKTNPIKRWMDVSGSAVLIFPCHHGNTEFPHPITRWENNYRKFDYLGRLGDTVRFRDLPSPLRLDGVAEHFSADTATVESSAVLVCGSPGEVASDPTLGDKFQFSTGRDLAWWQSAQREWVFTETALSGGDQLRQRVAWSLAQLLVVVKGAIESQWRRTESFLAYHDIFVRNAFGNYLDILREVSYNALMAENLSYLNSRSASYIYRTQRKHSFADENYAREIMQLFTIGLFQLNPDGSVKRDPATGDVLSTYTNEHIMSFARAWTGFTTQQRRGNIEEPDHLTSVDPMRITADWRDKFPKSDLNDGYVGDGYPLCVDLPDKVHLKKGAVYRLIGGSNLPELMEDPVDFATDETITKLELAAGSALGAQLCNDSGSGCVYANKVTLSSTVACPEGTTDVECSVDTIRTVKVSPTSDMDIYYEYVRPPCVEQAFYNNALKISQRSASYKTMCANPQLPAASEACCATGSTSAQRNFVYHGERMTKSTALDRCAAMEGSMFACDFTTVSHTAWYQAPNYFWTKNPCKVQVKVKSDNGYAAVVYHPSGFNEKEDHVADENRNYFKVYWNGDGTYPNPNNGCGEGACTELFTGGCLCDTTVSSTRVFSSMPGSAAEAMSRLKIGALDPVAYDLVGASGGYAAEPETVTGVVAYTIGGAYNEDTVFAVTDPRTGRTLHLKNSQETVSIVNGAAGMSFRNAPTFMSLIPSEATVRDAQFETEATLEHYFYQESTAPFLAVRLIQRMVSSNPSPRYVEAVATAFRTGTYTAPSGTQTYGTGQYGDMAASIAAVLLDREARTPLLDADPSTGSLREPLLKVLGLMRSFEYQQLPRYKIMQMWEMQDKIGQMAHEFPSVFSFFLPEHIPNGRIGEAGLVGPEEMLIDMPKTVSTLNGMFGLIKLGLTDCNGGFGNWQHGFTGGCHGEGSYTRAQGNLTRTVSGAGTDVADDLATLLTAGRLSADNRAIIASAYDGAAATDAAAGLRLAQQLVITTPEFHSTNVVKKSGAARPPPEQPAAQGTDYKAVVYLMFAGGADSFNMLAPKECAAKDLYAEYVQVREQVALGLDELIDIPAGSNAQVCEVFGVHDHLPDVASMYTDGDLLFFANTGVMTQPVTKDDYYLLTKTPLFSHNHMQRETMRIDPLEEKSSTGVIGRMSDALARKGLSVGSFALDHNSISLIGEPGVTSPPFIVSQHGITEFNPYPSAPNMTSTIQALNEATSDDSGYFGETWSHKLTESMVNNDLLHSTLSEIETSVDFPDTWLGRKMRTVARMIATRSERGVDRDMFYVDVGGWDTHSDVRDNLINRFAEVNGALAAFRDELKNLTVWDDVATIQTSDFARTLAPNTGDGTDHAWGGNYMMFGGAVDGGKIAGTYPDDLSDDGPLGLGRGRLIPTTPWDAAFWGLAEWVGVDPADMAGICPNEDSFPEGTMFGATDLFKATAPARKQRYLRK